jgi:glycosyltransferase involved in cell wall biosynthesis
MKKIRIGVETSVATFSDAGTARYAVELVHALNELSAPDLEIVELKFGRRHQFVTPGLRRKLVYVCWEKVYCRQILSRQIDDLELDVLHATAPIPFPQDIAKHKARIITTIHDLIAFSNPEWFSRVGAHRTQQDTRKSVRVSQQLLAVSNATRAELNHRLGVPEGKITTVHSGKPNPTGSVREIRPRQPFIISVGTLEPRKNLIAVLSAYASLKNCILNPPTLVLVGRKGWGDLPLEQVISNYDLEQNVVMLGYVSDMELAALYTLAQALIYPSLREGFGLPVLEAMTYGCPVITSNSSSLPEIAGNAAILVDPHSHEDLCRAMYELILDPERQHILAQRGIQRAAQFSWENCAQQTAAIYRKLTA